MTTAVLLAALAGVTAAAALVEAANVRRTAAIGGQTYVRLIATLARVGRRVGLPVPNDLQARLHAAGLTTTPADFNALKAGAALAMAVGTLPLALTAPGRLGLAVLIGAPAAGFLAPDAWLARRARRRAEAMRLESADVLDLLRVALAAGLTPTRALKEVGTRRKGTLGAELAATAARIELGVPRRHAYERLAARCPVTPVDTLATALQRADHHGTPLAPLLHSLAADARADRARALHERAAKAAPKIQLVVALLLVPAVLLLVAAALAEQLT